ncbi:hypothetical protein KEM48_003847 [Puccinia striiformis f. sp. tritici PST-130]|nr:hypothetical protein KEM48_003847 [Puccinia striiformis f. sp. tritici PST-130]
MPPPSVAVLAEDGMNNRCRHSAVSRIGIYVERWDSYDTLHTLPVLVSGGRYTKISNPCIVSDITSIDTNQVDATFLVLASRYQPAGSWASCCITRTDATELKTPVLIRYTDFHISGSYRRNHYMTSGGRPMLA